MALAVVFVGALLRFHAEEPAAPVEPEPRSVRGVVRLPGDGRAAFAILHVNVHYRPLTRIFAFADGDGWFAIPVPPGGWPPLVDLVVEHPGAPRNVFALSQEELASEAIKVRLTSMTLSGRAVDRDLRPLPYTTIDILGGPPSFWRAGALVELLRFPSAQADADGRFTARVQRRFVLIECRTPCLSSGLLTLAAPEDVVDLGDVVLLPHAPSTSVQR